MVDGRERVDRKSILKSSARQQLFNLTIHDIKQHQLQPHQPQSIKVTSVTKATPQFYVISGKKQKQK